MAYARLAFRYTPGKESNLVGLIFSMDRLTMYVSGTSLTDSTHISSGTVMTSIIHVADANYSIAALTAGERVTSNGTSTGMYYLATFPAIPAASYIVELYDVASPSASSPSPGDIPITGNGSNLVYWDGTNLWEGALAIALTANAVAQIEGVAAPAAGADQCTLTFTDSGSGLPIADAHVWVTTDLAGTHVQESGTTDDFGKCRFMLNAGSTYFMWLVKSGEEPLEGVSFVATAD